jgi:hypothetical protein
VSFENRLIQRSGFEIDANRPRQPATRSSIARIFHPIACGIGETLARHVKYEVHGRKEYERLAGISVSHLYKFAAERNL